MKILLCGAAGQLGQDICARNKKYEIVPVDLPKIDITKEDSVAAVFDEVLPDVVINAAAYTAVDKAEEEKEKAYLVNETGAANLARAAKKCGARFLHVSTDYVFGNGFSEPIKEDAPTGPLNVYGASKLAGEKAVLDIYPEGSLILRTASLHGKYGPNFVHTMLRLFKERESISVVSDQVMSPTWAGWLAETLLEMADRKDCLGIVHATSGEAVSWYDFTCAILDEVKGTLERIPEVKPILAKDYPRAATRANYSVLCADKLRSFGVNVIGWRTGLRGHLNSLGVL